MAGNLKGVIRSIKKWVLPPGITEIIKMLLRQPAEEKQVKLSDFALLSENALLRDRHRGERCFILGAGSSIKKQDLKKLAGERVISVSNTFVHQDFPLFKPQYHVLPPVFKSHGHLTKHSMYIDWLREMEGKTLDAEMFFHIGDKEVIDKNGLFKNRLVHWVEYSPWDERSEPGVDLAGVLPGIWSVSETAIVIALYLGFDKIYLLGIDHDWFNGLHVYFYDKNTEHKVQTDPKKLDFADSEFQMRRHAYIFKKYKYLYKMKKNIFNANADPDSYVDVFPKVDFNSLFG